MATPRPPETPGPIEGKKPCPTGIVLSGGGVRGVAHIGVLRALLDHGIAPQCVAGVSAGALVGALYAAGHSPREMLRFFQTVEPAQPHSFCLRQAWLHGHGEADSTLRAVFSGELV